MTRPALHHVPSFESGSASKQSSAASPRKRGLAEAFSIAEAYEVAAGKTLLFVDEHTEARLQAARERLDSAIDERRVIYGITTGFGPLATQHLDPKHINDVQRNLIYHLASGVGAPLSAEAARALTVCRLISMTRGYSAASSDLVALMVSVLNAGLAPYVPEKGTVGASGDLTPSSHMALALMGEGHFLGENGEPQAAAIALKDAGLKPYDLVGRDGLALVNGTSAMTGIAVLNHIEATRAVKWSLALSALHCEIMGGHVEAWAPLFGEVRPHAGQTEAIRSLSLYLTGSSRVDRKRTADTVVDQILQGAGDPVAAPCPQDPYSIRCVPQILGAVLDVLRFHGDLVETELNAVTDNPLIDEDAPYALHGGNFYGQHVAFASDNLMLGLVKVAILSERQIARITDPQLNKGLPAFLQGRQTGLHSGFMGAQVTASALLAEMRTNCVPASVQSVPTNGNNQDVVSMGTIAARNTRVILGDLYRVLAIQGLLATQAMDILGEDAGWSPTATAIHRFTRGISDFVDHDRPLSQDIERMAEALKQASVSEIAEGALRVRTH